MFLKTGSSLFGSTGLVISIFILILLAILSYSKCNAFTNKIVEQFETTTTTTTIPNTIQSVHQPPTNLRVNVKGRDLIIDFTFDYSSNQPIPKSFMVLLVQYDSNMKPTGEIKLFESKEYDINSSVAINEHSFNNNLCFMNNDKPACKYTINNLDIADISGNIYYYKLGIMAVYNDGNSPITTPYNVNTVTNTFSLDTSLNLQNKQFADYKDYQIAKNKTNILGSSYSNAMATADGQYELIKAQLGNYPSNLLLDTSVQNPTLLNDLVDKSMALGILNIDVKVAENTTTDTQ
jgi:hypothetical protein